jgi:hypothetical protein
MKPSFQGQRCLIFSEQDFPGQDHQIGHSGQKWQFSEIYLILNLPFNKKTAIFDCLMRPRSLFHPRKGQFL